MENTQITQFANDEAVFFLAQGGDAYEGPFRPSEIYTRLMEKKISWIDFCYREQEGKWLKIADHPVFQALQAEPPKPKPVMKVSPPPPPAAKAPEVPQVQWFLFQNEIQTGPYTTSDLRRLQSTHQLATGSYVWQEAFTDWKQIQDVSELAIPASAHTTSAQQTQPAIQSTHLTADQKIDQRADRRVSPRKPLMAELYLTNHKEVTKGLCRDISVGGMQILCDEVPGKPGESVRVNALPVGDARLKSFVAEGVIVRHLEDRKGFSLRFTKLSDDARTQIERYIT